MALILAIVVAVPFYLAAANPGFKRLGGSVVHFSDFEMLRTPAERHAHCKARVIDARDPDFMAQFQADVKKPALIINLIDTWPALKTWSAEQFKQTVDARFDSGMTAKPWNFTELHNPHCDDQEACLPWLDGFSRQQKHLMGQLFNAHNKAEYFELMNHVVKIDDDVRVFDTPNAILFNTQVDEEVALFEAPLPKALESASVDRHVAFGAYGTSHGFHRHNEAIQGQIVGYKSWYVLPRDVYTRPVDKTLGPAPGGFRFEESSKQANSICGFQPQDEVVKEELVTCVQGPGELMYVPSQWWHGTCNLDEFSAAAGMGLSWRKAGVVPDGSNVTFTNNGEEALDAYVIHKEDGFEQFLGRIEPKASVKQPTHDGHLYRFKNPETRAVVEKRTNCDDGDPDFSMDILQLSPTDPL